MTVKGPGVIRVERASMGSQAWQSIGCHSGSVVDNNLAPGTQYQYRVTENAGGAIGQTIVVAATPSVPDSPIPTAAVTNCTATACQVTLNWNNIWGGADDYRIESSYGLYLSHTGKVPPFLPKAPTSPLISVLLWPVPKGVHVFTLTTLFPSMRPSPKAPGQVTVVVP
jgi:hypothetical protein